ncbi:hypothetical protein D9M70_603150 [compost metagenome]
MVMMPSVLPYSSTIIAKLMLDDLKASSAFRQEAVSGKVWISFMYLRTSNGLEVGAFRTSFARTAPSTSPLGPSTTG